MTRLNITAEGFAEERLVTDILRPHLLQFGIYTDVRKVITSRKLGVRGGITSYARFRDDVTRWIKEDPKAWHSTCIDLYGPMGDFPGNKASAGWQPYPRVHEMQRALAEDIGSYRFIPYIQLHEFEALLFSDPIKMEMWLGLYHPVPAGSFQRILDRVGNPELINEGLQTAPSKRILSIYPGYDKIDDGILLLHEIGLGKLRENCPNFNDWVTRLEGLKG